ncbi:MAG TPA: DUF2135 domain-containing protein, partial [Flavitalea sp.]|nr:DUF2135 domain-containing protein [Flavitalea sp.]
KQAKKGIYKIRVNYYGDRYQKVKVPSFIKVTIYKNYGKADQEMKLQTLIMDGQNGKIEIASVQF